MDALKEQRIEFIFDEVARKLPVKKKDIGVFKKIIDRFDLREKSILEVGCGIGDNLIYCAQQGVLYAEGFDISGESIKLAQEKAGNRKNIFFHKSSIEEYSTERKFDYILVWGVFEYVQNPLESLKKLIKHLVDQGTIILFISKPILIKKISFLFRIFLSKIPLTLSVNVAKKISNILSIFSNTYKRILYAGESKTYTFEQTILEGLMVPRYNLINPLKFSEYLQSRGFLIDFQDDIAHSMTCIIARKLS
jgi:2-polyprenyl-3-methyl-5-hydroxy-6-metoxy-1,4-benzoquinol methylase